MQDTEERVGERAEWLEHSPFGKSTADRYWSFSESVVEVFIDPSHYQDTHEAKSVFDLGGWFEVFKERVVSALLRIGFLVIPFWWAWIVAGVLGFFGGRMFLKPRRAKDVLGICHRGKGPFYSGIYGPYRPNNGLSVTDLSCPSLACPRMEKKHIAENHQLSKLLRDYNAFNQTNLDLVRIILAHRNYPSFVEEEHVPDEEPETNLPQAEDQQEETKVNGKYLADGTVTIEESSLPGLRAVLEAHQVLARFCQPKDKLGQGVSEKQSPAQERFLQEREELEKALAGRSPLTAILTLALTPLRRRALAEFPVTAVASAYLAVEAGKSLVFKRVEGGFSQISRFPNLQSRAVIQSILSYHTEYNGDLRLQIRQALICSILRSGAFRS